MFSSVDSKERLTLSNMYGPGMTVNDNSPTRLIQRTLCELTADCIKLSGAGALDLIRVINYSREGMGLISRTAMEIGSYLIIRMHNLSSIKDHNQCGDIRTVGVTEVRWIKKHVGDTDSQFITGVKYLFVP